MATSTATGATTTAAASGAPSPSKNGPSSAAAHAAEVATLQQLHVLHDSNALLRDEAQRLQARVARLEEELGGERRANEPLHKAIRELQAEKEAWTAERDVLRDDNRRWKERTEHVLTKYHQIDPVVWCLCPLFFSISMHAHIMY